MKVYLAGDLMIESSRHLLEEICSELEKRGFKVFLPHRDAGLMREQDVQDVGSRKKAFEPIFTRDIDEIKQCEYAIFLLDGLCFGTTLELGWTYTLKRELNFKIVIIGLYTDIRGLVSLDFMRTCSCDFIVTSVKELLELITNLSKRE